MPVTPATYPGTMSEDLGGVAWSNINNAKVEDGNVALSGVIGPGGGGGDPNQLNATNFGFSLPSSAIIDGIKLEIKVNGGAGSNDSGYIYLKYGSNNTSPSDTPNSGQNWFHSGTLTWQTYGSSTSLWGRTWTPAEINASSFGASIASMPNTGTSTISVDAIRITIYYHLGLPDTPADVSTREYFKVYSQDNRYLGTLPTPTEPLKIAQDKNSLGSQITLNIPVSADVIQKDSEVYTTEDGSQNYTTEDASDNYQSSSQIPIISAAYQGIDTLIKNGNTVECWLVNYWHPNGKRMFVGKIRRWEADYGSDSGGGDSVNIILYSKSYDMDNYIARGAPFVYTNDQSQTSHNDTITASVYDYGGWMLYGQTWKVGTGVTNLGAISLMLQGTARVTVNVFDAPNGGNFLGSITQDVSAPSLSVVQFGFPSNIAVTAGNTYFFEVRVPPNSNIILAYQNTNVYANGSAYNSNYAGGSGGDAYGTITGDLYFVTASSTPTTSATYSSKDPTTEMAAPIITDYNLRGGAVTWSASTIDATGLTLTYKFNVQTVYEAMSAVLSLCPDGFYYYIDLGTMTIYFKNQSTSADFLLQKGVHINALKLAATNEGSKNLVLFTGGDDGSGNNLYKAYPDNQSIGAFGPLLDRKTDSRVTVSATADAIGNSELAELADEQFQTSITILHTKKLDITLLVPGMVIGFRGYGTFVDSLLLQIVHREWSAEAVTLTVGLLPKRLTFEYENTTRQLIAQQTLDNPSSPS